MATMAYAATSMAVLGFRLPTTTAKNCGRSALPYLPLRPSTPFLSTNIKHSTGEDAHWFSSFQIRASEQTSGSVEDIEVFSDIKEKESFKYPVKRTLLKVSADRQCRTYFALGFLLNSIISPSANATILKQPVDVSDIAPNMQNHIAHTAHDYIQLLAFADLDPATAKLAIGILGPLFSAFSFLFIVRIVMSWYPKLPVGKFPYVLAYAPTEPILIPTRKLIPPLGGVDVTPVVWFGLISFLNEILVGPQGLLILLSQQVQ